MLLQGCFQALSLSTQVDHRPFNSSTHDSHRSSNSFRVISSVAHLCRASPSRISCRASPNRRLIGRGEAHATCLALRIAEDGEITLANAGHMPPYLNGEPVAMEGALPLGMIEGAEFSVMRFRLAEGDKLMLVSDGVAEATDADGQLFGFERVHELMRKGESASQVADAAQRFGQEDDITVIEVTRTAVLEPALA